MTSAKERLSWWNPNIPPLDGRAREGARDRDAQLTKPPGSLGRLERLAQTLAAIQSSSHPSSRPAATLIFAADHPVCRHGVSAYPQAVTAAMMQNFLCGGAASSVMARHLGVALRVVDVGVENPYDVPTCHDTTPAAERDGWEPSLLRHDAAATVAGDIRVEDAMSAQTFELALRAGRDAVDELPPDTRVVALGDMGIGNTTPAAAIACSILGATPETVTGHGTGLDRSRLLAKIDVVRDAAARAERCGPLEVLRKVGGREIAALTAAIIRSAERRIVALIDGVIVTAAALVATRFEPQVVDYLVFAHRSREPAHGAMLETLGVQPLLDLDFALGEATGALSALSLLDLACVIHRDMATFADAKVPDRDST